MLFSSLEFIFLFLPISLSVYFLFPLRFRNLVLLLFSLIFYGFGEPIYVFLMVVTVVADHLFGALVHANRKNKRRAKLILVISVIFNLGLLAYFKYYGFFSDILSLFGIPLPNFSDISLPIGISFYTFQAMSYVIDVYRKDVAAEKNPIVIGTYVTLFPQLIAGPIIRYKDIAEQLKERAHSLEKAASGIRRFSLGLAKKCILANSAGALFEDFCHNLSTGYSVSTLSVWIAVISFSFQIYFDFSGYSDMAIGLGRLFGFEFPENFNYPYISKSITEFWRRWHITLSSWFKEYVYIPLGGNRHGKLRMYLNLLIVWSLTGLWHGAALNFLLWGLYYFLLLASEKAFFLKVLERIPAPFCRLYALFFILIGWLIFAADGAESSLSLIDALFCFSTMFGIGDAPLVSKGAIYELLRNLPLFAIMAIASTPTLKKLLDRFEANHSCAHRAISNTISVFSLVLCTAYLVNSGYNPFLYFRF